MDRATSRLLPLPVLLVVMVACARVLASGRTFASDTYQGQVVPSLAYIGARLGALEVPQWWDGVGLGVPFAANPDHPALYPPAWLMAVLPEIAGADLLVVAHLAWLGVGVAWLGRRLGGADAHVIVAGGAASVSGAATWAVASGSIFALAWAPWVMLAAARLGAARDLGAVVRGAVWLALASAALLMAGPLGYAPTTAVIALCLAIACAPIDRRRLALGTAIAGLLGGVLVSAVSLVPAMHLQLTPSPLSQALGADGLLGIIAPLGGGSYLGVPLVLLAALTVWRRSLAPLVFVAVAGVIIGCLRARGHLAPSLLLLASLSAVGLTQLSVWLGRRPRLASVGLPLVAVLIVGHMIALSWRDLPRVERSRVDGAPFLMAGALAQADGVSPRVARSPLAGHDDRPDGDPVVTAHRTARPNRSTRFGGSYALGVDRAISPRLRRAWRAAALGSERFLDLYAIELVAIPETVALAATLPVVEHDPLSAISLVSNEVRRPRAFVAARWRWYADDVAVQAALFPAALGGPRGIELSTARLIGVGADGGPVGPAPARPCVIARLRAEHVELDCPSDAAGYAVLLGSWDPGWSARVAGQPRVVERADMVARAVRIDRDQSRLIFVYRAPGLELGGLVSGLALLNLVVLAFIFRRKRGRWRTT